MGDRLNLSAWEVLPAYTAWVEQLRGDLQLADPGQRRAILAKMQAVSAIPASVGTAERVPRELVACKLSWL